MPAVFLALLAFVREHFDVMLMVATPAAIAAVVLLFGLLSRIQQDQLIGCVKGAYDVLAAVAPSTPFTWDDAIAALLKRVEQEMGRRLKPKEILRAKNVAISLLANDGRGDLVKGHEKARALNDAFLRGAK